MRSGGTWWGKRREAHFLVVDGRVHILLIDRVSHCLLVQVPVILQNLQ